MSWSRKACSRRRCDLRGGGPNVAARLRHLDQRSSQQPIDVTPLPLNGLALAPRLEADLDG